MGKGHAMELKALRQHVIARIDAFDEAQLQGLSLILDSMAQAATGEPETTGQDSMPTAAQLSKLSKLSETEKLYYRSLGDLLALLPQVASIRDSLLDKERFLEMMDQKGKDRAFLEQSVQFAHRLDRALEAIINLMQYDERTRLAWDIRNGFQFKSGSMNFVRWYFSQPEIPVKK